MLNEIDKNKEIAEQIIKSFSIILEEMKKLELIAFRTLTENMEIPKQYEEEAIQLLENIEKTRKRIAEIRNTKE